MKSLTNHCISRGFTLLNDQISEFYTPNGCKEKDGMGDTFVHPSEVEIHLAKLIPVVNGLFAKKLPHGLTKQLMANEKLKTLGANVYECFSTCK